MSGNLANSNYPQFQKALNTVAQDAARGNERFPARNFLLDEGVCMERANPYLTSMEPRIASTAWTELHGEHMTSRIWLPRGKANHGVDPIAQCAETFALKPDFLRYGSASPSLTLIRCEEPRVICKIAGDSGFIDLANEARLLGLLRDCLAKPNDAQLREDLQEVLDIYAEYADARPIFAAFEEDLQETLKDEDMWQDHLRNALGLSHIKQGSQVILLRYPVARIPSVPGLANTRALVCPSVLDNALSNAFCPSPANAPTGHTVHLAPEDFKPCREVLHPRIKWQAKDIVRLGEIILETFVERAGVCGFPGAGQGATTRNGHSIARSCNAAMRPENRAIQPVALLTKLVNPKYMTKLFRTTMLHILASGQRRFLGSRPRRRRNSIRHALFTCSRCTI